MIGVRQELHGCFAGRVVVDGGQGRIFCYGRRWVVTVDDGAAGQEHFCGFGCKLLQGLEQVGGANGVNGVELGCVGVADKAYASQMDHGVSAHRSHFLTEGLRVGQVGFQRDDLVAFCCGNKAEVGSGEAIGTGDEYFQKT